MKNERILILENIQKLHLTSLIPLMYKNINL